VCYANDESEAATMVSQNFNEEKVEQMGRKGDANKLY